MQNNLVPMILGRYGSTMGTWCMSTAPNHMRAVQYYTNYTTSIIHITKTIKRANTKVQTQA